MERESFIQNNKMNGKARARHSISQLRKITFLFIHKNSKISFLLEIESKLKITPKSHSMDEKTRIKFN